MDNPTKHQKVIPANIVLQIYRKQHYHLSTSIGQLITGDFSLELNNASTPKPPKGRINKHAYCGRGTSGYTGNDTIQ